MPQQQETLHFRQTNYGMHMQSQIIKSKHSCRRGCICKLTLHQFLHSMDCTCVQAIALNYLEFHVQCKIPVSNITNMMKNGYFYKSYAGCILMQSMNVLRTLTSRRANKTIYMKFRKVQLHGCEQSWQGQSFALVVAFVHVWTSACAITCLQPWIAYRYVVLNSYSMYVWLGAYVYVFIFEVWKYSGPSFIAGVRF